MCILLNFYEYSYKYYFYVNEFILSLFLFIQC